MTQKPNVPITNDRLSIGGAVQHITDGLRDYKRA